VPVIAIDTETELITPRVKCPRLVCVSSSSDLDEFLYKWDDTASPQVLASDLQHNQIVGHNVAYDLVVLANAYPELLPLIFAAYDANRITDTMLRQKLIDIAEGRQHQKYSLAALSERLLGVHLEKEDTWRLRYGELRDVPLVDWPPEARDYAITDATTTLKIYEAQEANASYLADQHRQSCHAFWLHLMSVWGFKTDLAKVSALEASITAALEQIKGELVQCGLLRADGTRDTAAAKARMAQAGSTKLTPKGAVSLDDEACRASGDPLLVQYAEYTHLTGLLAKDIAALKQGEIHTRVNSLLETGRTSCGGSAEDGGYNIQNPARTGGIRECFVPRSGYLLVDADFDGLELRTMAQVCLQLLGESKMAEALNAGLDPHLTLAAQLMDTTYEDAAARYRMEEPAAKSSRQFAKCFHPDTEVLTKRGWVAINTLQPDMEIATPQLVDDQMQMRWEVPLRLTTRRATELVHLKNEGIDLRVTVDHRMCGWTGKGEFKEFTPARLRLSRYWPNAGQLMTDEYPFDSTLLKLAVVTQADGSYSGRCIRFGFTKPRKIARFRSLFSAYADIQESKSKQGVTLFVVGRETSAKVQALLTPKKQFSWEWLELPPRAMHLVVDEARWWDGSCTSGQTQYQYTSVDRQNTDVLQAMATLTGHKTRLRTEGRTNRAHQNPWVLSVKNRDRSRGGNLEIHKLPYEGDVFCVTTQTDLVLVRDGGIPVITHQCGNFGFAGGMGVSTFVQFAANNGVALDEAKARAIKDAWIQTWPEFLRYFQRIAAMTQAGLCQIEQLYSRRWRGSCSYSQASNSYFQGLGADAAKAAGWAITKACYLPGSVLYGSRVVNFVHDEFLVEVPKDIAAECAAEIGRLMVEAANVWMPDVPAKTTPKITDCWQK
jgi:DNA polymerase I-like protein with 3'-5' exonuclease and polymerase domains